MRQQSSLYISKWQRVCLPRFLLALAYGTMLTGCASRHNALPASLPAPIETHPFDVLTQHQNAERTGAQLSETELTPAGVNSGRFGRLFGWKVDGQIYGQPLVLSDVIVGGRPMSLVIVVTMNNSVYAFEAPASHSTVRPSKDSIWHVDSTKLGYPLPYNYRHMSYDILGRNIDPLIGIVATPEIVRKHGNQLHDVLYVTAKSYQGGMGPQDIHYKLFAIDALTGTVLNKAEIQPSYVGSNGVRTSFRATDQLQRAALLAANDRIYVAFASHQDTRPYHGWIAAFDAATLVPVGANCTTCGLAEPRDCSAGSCEGGIWQAGGGPVADETGSIYVMTGNGTFDATSGDLATSFIRFDKNLNVTGSWTPPNYDCLNLTDSDLGSAGPTYLRNQRIIIGGGKQGLLYAIATPSWQGRMIGSGIPLPRESDPHDPCAYRDSDAAANRLSKGVWTIQAAPRWQGSAIMDILRLFGYEGYTQGYHHIHGSPVSWTIRDSSGERTLLYIAAERDYVRAYEFSNGFVTAAPHGTDPIDTWHSPCATSRHGMPGGFLSLSANRNDPTSGILWVATPRYNKDALSRIAPGVLHAYRAYASVGGALTELWNSDRGAVAAADPRCGDTTPGGQDVLGLFAKFVPPTISDGKVYMATFSHWLSVYGLKSPAQSALETEVGREYDAVLDSGPLPATAKPGSTVAVSLTARNLGTATWHISDEIRLASQIEPDFAEAITEGTDALLVRGDVAPGSSYTFNFHLHVPSAEAVYYYQWHLSRGAVAGLNVSSDRLGQPSREWELSTYRADCAELRNQASDIFATLPVGQLIPSDVADKLHAIVLSAEERQCLLTSESMRMAPEMTH